MTDITFHNVKITIANVKDAHQAYDYLCDLLGGFLDAQAGAPCVADWNTDTFTVDDDQNEQDTIVLCCDDSAWGTK